MKLTLLAPLTLGIGILALGACSPSSGTNVTPTVVGPDVLAGGTPTSGLLASPAVTSSPSASTAAQTAAEAFVVGGPRFVAAKAVAEAVDAGTYPIVFVDARPPTDYEFGHIPGAINVPYFEPEKHLDALPRDKWIVTYCECPHAEAEQVADVLERNGFTMVRVIDEGLQGWQQIGRPIEGGTAAPTD